MMRLKNMSSWIAVFIGLSLSACSDKDHDGSGPAMGITPVSVSFKENKTATVTIDYAGKWEAALSDTSWCTLDKSSGEGKGEIGITLKPRISGEPKDAKLTIRAVDHPSTEQVVELSLDGMDFYADPIRVNFGYGDNASYEIDVVCPGGWTATLSNNSWCDIDKPSGSGNDKIKITSKFDLASFGGKSAVLTVASLENPSLTATVDVQQVSEFLHGGCITLNKATKGKGIDFVIVGDGFLKREMSINGHWHENMLLGLEYLFKYEPLASFREYFNVYAVSAVSVTNVIENGKRSNTFFGSHFSAEGAVDLGGDWAKVSDFVYNNSPVAKEKGTPRDMFGIVLVNTSRYGGIGSINYVNENSCKGIGVSTLFNGNRGGGGQSYPDRYAPLIVHEFVGHAFGRLADEYGDIYKQVPEEEKKSVNDQKKYGFAQNIEFTSNSTQFDNKSWQELLKRNYPDVGIFQGGTHYAYGAWRSTQGGLMRDYYAVPNFGPVNREILVRKIYELAGIPYTLDEFIEYDKKNLK